MYIEKRYLFYLRSRYFYYRVSLLSPLKIKGAFKLKKDFLVEIGQVILEKMSKMLKQRKFTDKKMDISCISVAPGLKKIRKNNLGATVPCVLKKCNLQHTKTCAIVKSPLQYTLCFSKNLIKIIGCILYLVHRNKIFHPMFLNTRSINANIAWYLSCMSIHFTYFVNNILFLILFSIYQNIYPLFHASKKFSLVHLPLHN